jgi:thiamine monophosphate kinase
VLGIGDDAAAWQPSRSHLSVITTDALIDGVHFFGDRMTARTIGHRAMAANVSDIAAMGARPVLATIALGVAPGAEEAWLLELYQGMQGITACASWAGILRERLRRCFRLPSSARCVVRICVGATPVVRKTWLR